MQTEPRTAAGELAADKVQKYIESIQGCVRAWYAVKFPNKATELSGLRQGLDCLNRAGGNVFHPLAMWASSNCRSQASC